MNFDVWTSADCAAALGITPRAFGDLCRNPECPMPKPFGKAGNAQLWDPLAFRAGLAEVREWMAGADVRAHLKQQATLKAQEEALAARQAEFEREMERGRDMRKTFQQAQENAEELARRRRAHSGGEAIILDANGRRVR